LYDENDVLRKEVLQLLSSGKVVVPILVEDVPLPTQKELPPDLLPLPGNEARSINNGNWENVLIEIIGAMEERLK